jgi:PhnB protein
MLSDYFPGFVGDVAPRSAEAQGSVTLQVNLQTPQEVDAALARAAAAGATITMPATDTFWVMRYGRLKDPYSYVWAFGAPLPL